MREPKNAHMHAELRQRLDHLQNKLSQELGVDLVRRAPPNAVPLNRPRPMAAAPGSKAPLPGAWRTAIVRDAPGAALRVRRGMG